ncbi:MAG: hypothetical protein J6S19_06400, partial [Lentisphaeria bacterium]|nr:hypothetical protein [Lentisphaeria bacterium]
MRKIISIMMITGMLASNALSAKSAEQGAAPKVRVALYVDNGSRGNGVLQWAGLVAFSPQAEFST